MAAREQAALGSWLGAHFRSRQAFWQMAGLVKFKCAPLLTYIMLSIYLPDPTYLFFR